MSVTRRTTVTATLAAITLGRPALEDHTAAHGIVADAVLLASLRRVSDSLP